MPEGPADVLIGLLCIGLALVQLFLWDRIRESKLLRAVLPKSERWRSLDDTQNAIGATIGLVLGALFLLGGVYAMAGAKH